MDHGKGLLKINTPVEQYEVKGRPVFVKREDLCVEPPGPPFSKVRGIVAFLAGLKSKGVKTVAYLENSTSMASWGVSWAAQALGLKAVIFAPEYKEPKMPLEFHRQMWGQFNPEIVPYRPMIQKADWHAKHKQFKALYPDASFMLPLGLPFEQTRDETAAEVQRSRGMWGSLVINIGSGTICSGVVRGLEGSATQIIAVWCSAKAEDPMATRERILAKAGVLDFGGNCFSLDVIPNDMKYGEPDLYPCPFPCNPYYDRRAWHWLCENIDDPRLRDPILFWNIGAGYMADAAWGSR